VDEFLADWYPGWAVYLPTLATQDVIDRFRDGERGLPSLEGWVYRSWDSHRPVEVSPGVYEVAIDLRREGEIVAELTFMVGPGTTADGRDAQLVVIDAETV
jgi:hypothetical protein